MLTSGMLEAEVSFAVSHPADVSAIKNDLGYQPVKSIEQGTTEVIEWLKNETIRN